MNITVLGFGSWGGTIAQHLTMLDHKVIGWHKFPEEVEKMQKTLQHNLIPQLQISKDLQLTTDLKFADIVLEDDLGRTMSKLMSIRLNKRIYLPDVRDQNG